MNRAVYDSPMAQIWNVAGELLGAVTVYEYCIEHNIKKATICYDYLGIERWFTGEWKANNEFTQNYKRTAERIKKKVDVKFIKIKGHTGNIGNEIADELAKAALGIRKGK